MVYLDYIYFMREMFISSNFCYGVSFWCAMMLFNLSSNVLVVRESRLHVTDVFKIFRFFDFCGGVKFFQLMV